MNISIVKSLCLASLAGPLMASACLEITELPDLPAEGGGGMGAMGGMGGMGAMGGMSDMFMLSDQCGAGVVEGVPSMEPKMATTMNLTDTVRDLGSCNLGSDLTGVDGFFTVDVLAGERWHMMVMPGGDNAAETDVAAFILTACDERTCDRGHDQCGNGGAEHINFAPSQSGTYIFGIEASLPGSVMVMLMKPPCGDGEQQHGETCDDGNLDVLDGCTPSCQSELIGAVADEVEPNDESLETNIVRLPAAAGAIDINGTVGGKCDVDRFHIDVPEGGAVTASLLLAGGGPCTSSTLDTWMVFELIEDQEGHTITLGEGMTGRAAGTCPSIEVGDAWAEALPAGSYSVTVGAARESEQFDYRLHIEVSEAL